MKCQSRKTWMLAIAIAIGAAMSSANADVVQTNLAQTNLAETNTAEPVPAHRDIDGLRVTVEGSGPALVFIPGLNSASGTFTETCAAFKAQYTCHLLHLPGFAGNAPIANLQNGFLIPMRDRVEHYIRSQALQQPVLVGHSLGGVLSLMVAEHAPELTKGLVIVDSLPFYSAIQNPAATPESVRPYAEQMRKGMLAASPEDYQRNTVAALRGMSRQPERMPTLTAWGHASDRATTAQAMYDMMTMDFRPDLARIKTPAMVLGAWAAYASFGATKDSTRAIFTTQYATMPNVQIHLSETAYHFITWDDPQWVTQQMSRFLQAL